MWTPEDIVKEQIRLVGDNPTREGLIKTPERVVRAWGELFSGYGRNPKDLLTVFDKETYDQMVLLKGAEIYSMCEHHMLPFFGKVHVAYIPGAHVIGISKLARLVDIFAKRLQIQERIGEQVTQALMDHLQPLGAACIIEAEHMCMRMRGCHKQDSIMVTSSLKGIFFSNPTARAELFQLINR